MTVKKNARTRSFTTKKTTAEPILIEIDDEQFYAHPRIPGADLLDFISAGSEGISIAGQMLPFLKKTFPETEFARLKERLYLIPEAEDKTKGVVDEELIGEIVSALIEEYTNSRPTPESDQSSATS